jgi:hypothetical protein
LHLLCGEETDVYCLYLGMGEKPSPLGEGFSYNAWYGELSDRVAQCI